jgi:hypothetical protein
VKVKEWEAGSGDMANGELAQMARKEEGLAMFFFGGGSGHAGGEPLPFMPIASTVQLLAAGPMFHALAAGPEP